MKRKNYKLIVLLVFFALAIFYKNFINSDLNPNLSSLLNEKKEINLKIHIIKSDDEIVYKLAGNKIDIDKLTEKVNQEIDWIRYNELVFNIYASPDLKMGEIHELIYELIKTKKSMRFIFNSL